MEISKFLHHSPCPNCGSSDALAVYSDHSYCFSCHYYTSNNEEEVLVRSKKGHKHISTLTSLPSMQQPGIPQRKILDSSVLKYGVTVDTNPNSPIWHVYPYFDEEGVHVANKIRKKGEKSFYWEGDYQRGTLFGQQAFPPGGKAITITEGECDAMAAFQMAGSRYPTVSVKSASSAKKDCAASFEYLNTFEKIVICFDSDEPGQKAAQQVAQLFAPGKAHIVKLAQGKDPNDYLIKDLAREFVNEWFRAPAFTPEGLRLGTDMWSVIENHKDLPSVPYPWEGLNRMTYGIRTSEVVLITAETGIGKTSVIKEIEYALLSNPDLIAQESGVGILHLEEPNYDTVIGLMSVDANKPFHLPDTERTLDELRHHFNSVINHKRIVIYDHFGSNDVDTVLSKIRHMAALGCKYIFLDHLSIIVSDHSGDERKQLDEISTKLKMLCMNLGIGVIAVIHVNRQGTIRGSAGPEQIANIVMRLLREKTDLDPWRRNVTKVVVEKNRLCGRTGPACYLFYNEETGRLEELSSEAAAVYEQGVSLAGDEFAAYS